MDIVVKEKSVEVNLILDILTGYQNKENLDLEFKKLGMVIPKECVMIYKEIDKSDMKFKKLVKYYFYQEGDEANRMYHLARFLNLNLSFYDLDFEDYIKRFEMLTKEQVLKNIFATILYLDDDNVKYKELTKIIDEKFYIDEEIVIKKLDESNLSYSLRWKLYNVIRDYTKGINDLIYILKEFKRIKGKNYVNLLSISKKWSEDVKEIFDNKGEEYLRWLDKSIDLSIIKKLYIKPVSAWKCYNVELRAVSDEEFELIIGYNIEQTLDRFRRGESEEWFKEVLKLLADPTRYKILKLLSKKDMYSGELAVETNMSQGTISHHMSNLVLYDLVEDFRKDGRVYYRLNKEKFKIWIEMLRKTL